MSYLCFMRRSIVGLLLSLSLVACEKAEIKLSEIGSIPVSDAAYIFQREGNRSESDDEDLSGVWKVTVNGEEVKLKVLDTEGNEIDIEIYSVENILENYLIVNTTVGKVLVDKTTNKVYECPEYLHGECRTEEYPRGTIYAALGWENFYKYMISTQSITAERLLPKGQTAFDFFLGQNEALYYIHGKCYEGGGKVMTSSKRLYPTDIEWRMFGSVDHRIYSIEIEYDKEHTSDFWNTEHSIYEWSPVGNDEIVKKFVTKISTDGFSEIMHFIPINTVNGRVVLFQKLGHDGQIYNIYEFDGKSCVLRKSYNDPKDIELIDEKLIGSLRYMTHIYKIIGKTNVYFDWVNLYKDVAISLDPITYEIKEIPYEIPEDQYEVYGTRTDASWGKMLFTALRYSDGSIVMGEVDDKGNVKIISERASTYHITEYFALN